MAYRELINVAQGAKGQIDAIISALDLHENPPAELEELTMKLEEAVQICDSIIGQGEDEPEESVPAPAEDLSEMPPIFEDPAPKK